MTRHDIASLAYKLMGIFVLTQAVATIGVLPYMMISAQVPGSALVLAFLPLGILLLLVWLLILCSDWLAERTFAQREVAPDSRMCASEWMSLACAAIGVSLLSTALPKVFAMAWSLLFEEGMPELLRTGRWSGFAGTLIQLCLGGSLFFGSAGFANWWQRIRAREMSSKRSLPQSVVFWALWVTMVLVALLMLMSFSRKPG